MKIWPWVFVVLAICGPDASAARAQGSAAGPLRIGLLTDMSGPNSIDVGPGGVAAARMAISDFGGNVFGRTVELLVGDHQNKPDVGLLIARKWYARTAWKPSWTPTTRRCGSPSSNSWPS